MKVLLWVVTILFFVLSWWWYVCPHKQVCPFGDYSVNPTTLAENNDQSSKKSGARLDLDGVSVDQTRASVSGPLFFYWSDDQPLVNPGFEKMRDSILTILGDSGRLKIIGLYFNDENNSTAFPNLGYARASKLKLLFRRLTSDRFQLAASGIGNASDLDKKQPFVAARFEPISKNELVYDVGDKVIINFPHASIEMLENLEIDNYLNDLVARLKSNEELVLLVGHTDNTASSDRNMSLGWKRANSIRRLLLRKGLPSVRILTDSQGEAQPIASNETAEGRRKNRRVEVTVIKDLN